MDTREVARQYRLAQWRKTIWEEKLSREHYQRMVRGNGIKRKQYFYWDDYES